jgi:4-oxalocrotonate tautomerase
MPILNVKISGTRSAETSRAVASHLMEITTRILHKKAEDTAIAISFVPHEDWYIAGEPLSTSGRNSFYFDIRVTDETNTKAEKAAYIRAAFEGFARILGDLHAHSYVHVQDARAATYGYGGQTQEYRYQHPTA